MDLVADNEAPLKPGSPQPKPEEVCVYQPLPPEDAAMADKFSKGNFWSGPRPEGPGGWFYEICNVGGPNEFGTVVWLADRVDPRALAEEAKKRLSLGSPAAVMAPPVGRDQLVHEPTWLWVDRGSWQRRSATVGVPGVTVTAHADPVRVLWDMGDGSPPVVCGPGTPYDEAKPARGPSPDCGHTYRRASSGRPDGRYRVTVTVDWNVTWTVTGAPGGGDLGLIRPSSVLAVRVVEAHAVNTRPDR